MHLQLGGPGAKVMSSSAATSISLSSHKTNSDIGTGCAGVEDHVARQARLFCMASVYSWYKCAIFSDFLSTIC